MQVKPEIIQHNSTSPACPNCEFSGVPSGHATLQANSTWLCHACNTTWRELDAVSKPLPILKTSKPVSQTTPPASAVSAHFSNTTSTKSAKYGTRLFSTALLGVLAVGALGFYFSNSVPKPPELPKQLIIDNIKINETQHLNSTIWVISASILNNTANQVAVPAIEMQFGRRGSSGYFNRIYNPALQSLSPGARFNIRTSVRKPSEGSGEVKLEFAGTS